MPSSARPRIREQVLTLRTVWDCWQNGAKLNFKGEYYRFDLTTIRVLTFAHRQWER